MPYAPLVNDTSGQILAGYQVKAADALQQGQEKFGEGIGTALTAVGGGIGVGIKKLKDNTSKMEGAQATVQAMQSILPKYGDRGIALGDALAKDIEKAGTNADKISGTIMAYQPAMQSLIQTDHSVQVANAQAQAYNQRALVRGNSSPTLDVSVGEGVNIW